MTKKKKKAKESAVPTRLPGILPTLPPPPILQVFEASRIPLLSLHPFAFGTDTTEEERQRIIDEF